MYILYSLSNISECKGYKTRFEKRMYFYLQKIAIDVSNQSGSLVITLLNSGKYFIFIFCNSYFWIARQWITCKSSVNTKLQKLQKRMMPPLTSQVMISRLHSRQGTKFQALQCSQPIAAFPLVHMSMLGRPSSSSGLSEQGGSCKEDGLEECIVPQDAGCWVDRTEGDGSLFLPGEPLLTHGAAVTIRLRAGRV